MKTRTLVSFFAICLFFALGLFSTANAAVYVRKAPPARRVVVKPARPYKNAVWISGHWSVKKGRYVWVDGSWQKNRLGYVWIDGHWKKTPRGWIWVKGHWSKK